MPPQRAGATTYCDQSALFSIDATIPISAAPRLHPAIYFDRFGIGTYFDWMFSISGGPTGLKFYPGVGPEFFFENDFD